jgi:Usg-like family
MVAKDAVSKDFRMPVLGYGLTTAEIVYRRPDRHWLLQTSVSEFPGAAALSSLLAAKARRRAVCGHPRALQTDQACRTTPCATSSGYINARAQSFGVISVAHAQLAGKLLSARANSAKSQSRIFSRPTPTNWSNDLVVCYAARVRNP